MRARFKAILLSSFVATAAPAAGSELEVRREVYLMGTLATLETRAPDRRTGLERLESFIRILEDTEKELSTWRETSVLSRLNRAPVGSRFPLEPSLCHLLGEIESWNRRTSGAFDPAIGGLIDAWGLQAGGRWPGAAELESARQESGLEHLTLGAAGGVCYAIRERSVRIDAGAFGKGEALDRVRVHAARNGFDGWMIDLGGQILVHGTPLQDASWAVALAHPGDRERPALELQLETGSLATSGGSESDLVVGGERIGHILDPRTGRPILSEVSATVWHSSARVADILSTALYVMGVNAGLGWADENDIAVCFLVPRGEDIEVRASSLFERMFLGGAPPAGTLSDEQPAISTMQ